MAAGTFIFLVFMELIPENIKINKPGKKIIAVFVGFFVISIVEIFIWPSMTFLPFWDLTPVDSLDPIWLFYPIQSPDFIFWMQQFTSFCHFDFKLINKYFILYILSKFWPSQESADRLIKISPRVWFEFLFWYRFRLDRSVRSKF